MDTCPACQTQTVAIACPACGGQQLGVFCLRCQGRGLVSRCPACYAKKSALLDVARAHLPDLEAALRELYNLGLIPGLSALARVTINGVCHGDPPEPYSLRVTNPPPWRMPGQSKQRKQDASETPRRGAVPRASQPVSMDLLNREEST